MSNAMSLKAKIRNIAKQKNIPAQVILQNYMFERLLVRLAASAYKDKFVLKGGMLVAAIVGLDNRATMDLDTTLKNLPLTAEAIRSALEQVERSRLFARLSISIALRFPNARTAEAEQSKRAASRVKPTEPDRAGTPGRRTSAW